MKILTFYHRGQKYQVDTNGRIKANGLKDFSNSWIFLGGSGHHWNSNITVNLTKAFEEPKALEGCIGWDKDHGTTRTWAGRYNGKLPRITNVTTTQ